MKKYIQWSLILLFISLRCSSQTFQWANSEPYNSFITWTSKITHDTSGNTFIGGLYNGSNGVFIVKYDDSGNKLWEKNYIGYGCGLTSICTDSEGNLYCSLFAPNINGVVYSSVDGSLFIKYNPNGNILWVKQSKLRMLLSERTDRQDNIIVTGSVIDTVYLDYGIILSAPSGEDRYYLAKFNTDGECIWAQQNDGGNQSLICNTKGEMFVIAQIYLPTTIGQGSNLVTLYPSDGEQYLAKYDSIGELIWVKQTYTFGIAPDSEGNLYNFEPDRSNITGGSWKNIYLIKYDPLGNMLWKRTHLYTNSWYKFAMRTDSDGNLYATGGFTNYMTFDGTTIPDGGNTRVFVTKIDSAGIVKWISTSSGAGGAGAKDITISDNNEIYITGDMGGGENIFGDYSVTQAQGVFVAKIVDDDNIITPVVTNLVVSDNALSVYPNPTGNLFNVNYNSTEYVKSLCLEIRNALGQVVYSTTASSIHGEYKKTIDLSNENKGVYFIEINADKKRSVKKIVLN